MPSAATLTTLRARIRDLVMDSGASIWANAQVDEGLKQAIEFYSIVRPRRAVSTYTFVAASREMPLASLTGLQAVSRVWADYDATDLDALPAWTPFEVWDNDGVLTAWLNLKSAPEVADVARVWYERIHTLNGLDGATATTWDARDDGTLCIGAAGYMCWMRSIDVSETAASQAVSTPNLAAQAQDFLNEFKARLGARTPLATIADIVGKV